MAEPAASRVDTQGAERYWEELVEGFEAAAAAAGVVEHDTAVAGARIRFRYAGPELERAVFPSLAHLLVEPAAEPPERTVLAFDTASTGVAAPARAWGQVNIGPLGEIVDFGPLHGLADDGYGGLQVYDPRSRTLVYYAPSEPAVPWYERAAPVRAGMNWLLAGPERQLVHAAALGEGGRGVMLAGAGGSGKSTLAMACLEAGLEFAGDDYAVVTTEGDLRAHSIYCAPKLDAGSLARLPADVRAIVNPDFADGEKAVLRLEPARMTASVPISAVILPRVTGASPPVLRPASGAEALLALGPSSAFQLPGRNTGTFGTSAVIARNVPAFWLELGDDLDSGVARVREVLAG